MAKATMSEARRIAEFATPNIGYSGALKLCRTLGPKLNEYEECNLALWVCKFSETKEA